MWQLCLLQSGAIDAQAMIVALTACLAPPLPRLNCHKPSGRMCTMTSLARITVMAVGLELIHISLMSLLTTRPWFKGGTGNAYMVSIVTEMHVCPCVHASCSSTHMPCHYPSAMSLFASNQHLLPNTHCCLVPLVAPAEHMCIPFFCGAESNYNAGLVLRQLSIAGSFHQFDSRHKVVLCVTTAH